MVSAKPICFKTLDQSVCLDSYPYEPPLTIVPEEAPPKKYSELLQILKPMPRTPLPLLWMMALKSCAPTEEEANTDLESSGREVYVNDIEFTTADQMREFCSKFYSVVGNVTIKPQESLSLNELSCLIFVDGSLDVATRRATGGRLSSLKRVENSLSFSVDIDLNEIDPFPNLGFVGNNLTLLAHPAVMELRNFLGFHELEEIGGYFSIENQKRFRQVAGFHQVRSIGGGLGIQLNENLEAFSGFHHLQRVGAGLAISGNSLKDGFGDFESLEEVGGTLSVTDNTNLAELVWNFPRLRTVGGVYIADNPKLSRCFFQAVEVKETFTISSNDKLSNLTINLNRVGEHLIVSGNPLVITLLLNNLTEVGGTLHIVNNDALQKIDGNNTGAIIHHLVVAENDSLTDISGLMGIAVVRGDVRFTNNASLSPDKIQELIDAIGEENIGGKIVIENNGGS